MAADGRSAVREVVLQRPDVAMLDLQMPELDGFAATREITRAAPDVAVLGLTMFDDEDSVFAAMRAGARGYVVKGAEFGVHPRRPAARRFLPRRGQTRASFIRRPPPVADPFPELTSREVRSSAPWRQPRPATTRAGLDLSPETGAPICPERRQAPGLRKNPPPTQTWPAILRARRPARRLRQAYAQENRWWGDGHYAARWFDALSTLEADDRGRNRLPDLYKPPADRRPRCAAGRGQPRGRDSVRWDLEPTELIPSRQRGHRSRLVAADAARNNCTWWGGNTVHPSTAAGHGSVKEGVAPAATEAGGRPLGRLAPMIPARSPPVESFGFATQPRCGPERS